MPPSTPVVTIVGAGGIGCALGHALRLGGADVTFVEKDPRKLEWGRRNGVVIDESPAQPSDFVDFEDWRPSAGENLRPYPSERVPSGAARSVISKLPSVMSCVPM